MKNPKTYLPCVLVSIIFVFTLLGSGICVLADKVILNPQTCIDLVSEKQLDSKVKGIIDREFEEKYNSTGIPDTVYTEIITEEWVKFTINGFILEGFNYLNGETDTYSSDITDFTALDNNITEFFSNYADENGYVKDSSYEDKLNTEINTAHSIITNYTDIFKMNTLKSEGVLAQARRYIGYLDTLTYICIGGACASFILIVLLSIKRIRETLYWTGCSLAIAGIIGLVPCIYIKSSNYFDAFVIKQEQIFTAFTSFMYKIVDRFTIVASVFLVFSVIMFVSYAIINIIKGKQKES